MRGYAWLLLAACGGKSADECRVEATAVGDLLVEAAKEAPAIAGIADEVPLVTRTDLPIRKDLAQGPVVVLGPTAIKVGDKSLADFAALRATLREQHDKLVADLASGKQSPRWVPEDRLVYFAIDPATPWDRVVVAVGTAAGAGLSAPAFVFAAPQKLEPAPRSPVDDKLDAILKQEPSERAYQVAQLATKIVERCAPLQKAFGSVSAEENEDKGMTLARAVKPALIACECKPSIPELRSVMFRILYVPRPTRVIRFRAGAANERIALPLRTTWAEASARFTPALGNAELIVE